MLQYGMTFTTSCLNTGLHSIRLKLIQTQEKRTYFTLGSVILAASLASLFLVLAHAGFKVTEGKDITIKQENWSNCKGNECWRKVNDMSCLD